MEKQKVKKQGSKKEFDYYGEFGNGCRNRIIYDVKDLIKISKKNEGKVYYNLDFNNILKNIPNIKDKVFQVCYLSDDNEFNGKKIKTYISTIIVMGNLVKKRMKEYFVKDEFIGNQDIFLKQYRKLSRW